MKQDPQVQFTDEDVLNYYKQNYMTKHCKEIKFESSLINDEIKEYQKFLKSCCCVKPLSLLIYSIIILAFAFVGFFFLISENKGYKAYKEILERNISLINNEFPNELESLRLVSFLSRDKGEGDCTYLKYSLGDCKYDKYKNYCTLSNYRQNKCNYMDRRINGNFPFVCNYNNYKNGQCNHLQYIDNLKKLNKYSEESKINFTIYSDTAYVGLTCLSIEKKFCEIGKYDKPIYFSFIIIMVVFIILLIADLVIKRKTMISCIAYYNIIITFYIIYFVIFRIYVILFLSITFYGVYVCMLHPNISEESAPDPFFNTNEEILFPWEQLWKDKRINAFIFCGISFILFILVAVLSFYKKLIYNYLSFNFDDKNEVNNITILRKARINVKGLYYVFEIVHNKDLYLTENVFNVRHKFKEVYYKNNFYYLKCDNLDIKHQLSWNELRYPNIDEALKKLTKIFHQIFFVIFLLIIFRILNFEDDISFDYYMHLIELGYKPDSYTFLKYSYKYSPIIKKFIYISETVQAIIIMLSIVKLLIFGGFKNQIFKHLNVFIYIILVILNLVIILVSTLGGAFKLVSFLKFSDIDIKFDDYFLTNYQFYLMNLYFYGFIVFISIGLFIHSIKLVSCLNNINNQNQKLEYNNISQNKFQYISSDNQNFILESVNDKDFPKHLLYQKKVNNNPIEQIIPVVEQLTDKILCLEKRQEETLDINQNAELNNYNYKLFNTKRIIAKIVFNIIIISISIVLTIAGLGFSFKNNKYYSKYKNYLTHEYKISVSEIFDFNSVITGYIKFWCDFGNLENGILISFLLFAILFLLFEIFSLLLQKNIIKIINPGTIYYNIFSTSNIAFYIIFKIYFPLLLFLCIYSCIVLFLSPYDAELKSFNNENNLILKDIEKEWFKKKFILFVSIAIKLCLFIFDNQLIKIKYCIIDYLNQNYDENDEAYDEDEDDKIKNNKKIGNNKVNSSIIINNCKYNTQIKLNEILYLQRINNIGIGQIFKFKKINIENVTNNFIYVRLGPNSISDQISIAQWNYPDLNQIFIKLCELCNFIYFILFFSYPLFSLHVKDEIKYNMIKKLNEMISNIKGIDDKYKVKYSSIFDLYGSFEEKCTNARFILFIIELGILILFMLKRIYFGGFGKIIYIIISFIFSIIALILNIVFIILDLLIILFTVLSYMSFVGNKYYNETVNQDTGIIIMKYYLQAILNIVILVVNIKLMKGTFALIKELNKLRKEMVRFNNKEDYIEEYNPYLKPIEFKYVSLDGNICSIKEINNDLFQRYLFYSSDISQDLDKTQANMNAIEINNANSENNLLSSKNDIKRNKKINEKEENNGDISSISKNKLV